MRKIDKTYSGEHHIVLEYYDERDGEWKLDEPAEDPYVHEDWEEYHERHAP